MKTLPYEEFLSNLTDKSKALDFPGCGSFELTPLCNLDCKMCYVHLQDPSVKERMLTGDQWISILQSAVKKGMLRGSLTGGEAMTHPDFRQIYTFLVKSGVSVSLKSNGLLIKQNLDLLRRYQPRLLDISLYGCNDASYRAVTGHAVFNEVSEGIRAAVAAGLTVKLAITPSKYMQPWIDEVMKCAQSFSGIAKVTVNAILVEPREETGRSKEDFNLTPDENDRNIQKGAEMFPGKVPRDEEVEQILGKRREEPFSARGLRCNSGRALFAVHWDGTMVPCLDFPKELLCADPLRDGFEAAWQTINRGIREFAVPQKCHSCPINTLCNYCPVHHGKCALEHACDESVCAYWHNAFDKVLGK